MVGEKTLSAVAPKAGATVVDTFLLSDFENANQNLSYEVLNTLFSGSEVANEANITAFDVTYYSEETEGEDKVLKEVAFENLKTGQEYIVTIKAAHGFVFSGIASSEKTVTSSPFIIGQEVKITGVKGSVE